MPDRVSVTEDDVRTVLLARAEQAQHRSGRLDEVHQRVSQIRRRRAAVTAGLAVAAVTLGVVVNRPGGPAPTAPTVPTTPRPSASAPARPTDALPAYLRGGQLVASIDQRTPTAATLTFVPTSLLFGVVEGCSWPGAPAAGSGPAAWLTINGKEYMGRECSTDGPLGISGDADMGRPGADFGTEYGVHIGRPVVIRFGWPAHTARPGSRFRIGVYQAVEIGLYPFPTRPAVLQSPIFNGILDFQFGGKILLAQGFAGAPNGQFTSPAVQLAKTLTIEGTAVEPGEVDVLVNGRQIYSTRTWDYNRLAFSAQFSRAQLGLKPGQKAVVTVQSMGYTGATWIVVLSQGATADFP
jgi:hypothetical protein